MSPFKIYYYITPSGKNIIREFILSLQKNQQAKIRRQFQIISEYGLSSEIPQIKKLSGTPFWEIRILGKDNFRIIYAVPHQNSILILHCFNKKTRKTPAKELQTALNRYQEWQSRY